jgi:perosamine synthetase
MNDMARPIPWFGPEVGAREKELLAEVIDSNYINDGPVTRRFEAGIAKLAGTKYAVGVTSGTTAISLALMGLGVGHGDEVIVPDLTFAATANAVAMTGATVRLVDIEPRRFGLDPDKLRAALTPRTRAIVTVDVNGRAADYAVLEPLAREKGLALVTDSAEGLASMHLGRPLGSFGNAGCFSFSANKTVSTGQGGMITTNDSTLHDRLRELKDQGRRHQGTGGDDHHPVLGYNFKLTNLQSAVGLAQLERLPARLAFARQRDQWYRDALGGCAGIVLPAVDVAGGEAVQWTDALVEAREPLRKALDTARVGHRAFWFPVHAHRPYAAPAENYPVATRVSAQGLWLSSAYSITQADVGRACDVIRATLKAG